MRDFLKPTISTFYSTFTSLSSANPFPLTSLQCGSLLQTLTNRKSAQKGQELHAHMLIHNILHENTYLNTKLAAFYANCGLMKQAQFIFDYIQIKNSFLWNSMIKGYACCYGLGAKAVSLYRKMQDFGQNSDNYTYPFVLKAVGEMGLVEIGRRVHCDIVVCGFEFDVYVCNSLMAMYSRFGKIRTMRKVFDRMPVRDLVSWNTLISGYARNGESEEAFSVFGLMHQDGSVADATTMIALLSACAGLGALREGQMIHGYVMRRNLVGCNEILVNSLIEMYCCCNSMIMARKIFEQVRKRDVVPWNSLISGYARKGENFESLRLFCRMVMEVFSPDEVSVVSVLGACEQITALHFGLSIHSYVIKKGYGQNSVVGTALMDMYSKCGNIFSSRHVFDEMGKKSLVSWSSMITGYALHGKGHEALAIFNKLEENGIVPDEVVFTSLLSACSHAGLVEEGREIFYSMEKVHNIKPKLSHYSCFVDLLGRAGHLDEAYKLVSKMEINLNSDIWTALLSSAQRHKNVEISEIAAKRLFEINPKEISSYVSLSNVYASEKRWGDAENIRAMARRNGLKKKPGWSFVELDKEIHKFLVGDRSHPQSEEIHVKIKELREMVEQAGHKVDTSSVFYDVEESVKENMLWDHSERLALAFALIRTGSGAVIRITKNLRTCGDCHTVVKLLSKLTCREIVMRDIRRFHHFKDGVCSCGDYW